MPGETEISWRSPQRRHATQDHVLVPVVEVRVNHLDRRHEVALDLVQVVRMLGPDMFGAQALDLLDCGHLDPEIALRAEPVARRRLHHEYLGS
jgi:hypothetical protein